QHLTNYQLDVLVVDVDALRLVDLLHLKHQIALGLVAATELEQLGRVERAFRQPASLLYLLPLLDLQPRAARKAQDMLFALRVEDRYLALLFEILDVDL